MGGCGEYNRGGPSISASMMFSVHKGFISRGGDLHTDTMTVREAKLKCAELPGCKGFCHRGEYHDGPMEIFFKDKWDNTVGKNPWTSYQATPMPVEKAAPVPADQDTAVASRASAAGYGGRPNLARAVPIGHNIKLIATLEVALFSILEVVKVKASSVSFFCREYWGSSASMAQVALSDLKWVEPLGRNVRQACILESLSLAVTAQMSSGRMQNVGVGVRLKLRKLIYHLHDNCLISMDLLRRRLKAEQESGQAPAAAVPFDFNILAQDDRCRELSEGEHAGALKTNNEAILEILPALCSGFGNGKTENVIGIVGGLLRDLIAVEQKGVAFIRQKLISNLRFEPIADGSGPVQAAEPFARYGVQRFAPAALGATVVRHEPLPPMIADLEEAALLGQAPYPNVYTLVLDLDETLIHSSEDEMRYEVRPGMAEFLHRMCQLGYELVIFTSSLQDYADKIINQIDPNGLVRHRLYRQHGQPWGPLYLKDLSRLGRSLDHTLIIDDIAENFGLQPLNGISITPWKADNPYDRALQNIIPVLEELISTGSRVPDILTKYKSQLPKWVGPGNQNCVNRSMAASGTYTQPQHFQHAPASTPNVGGNAPYAPMMMMDMQQQQQPWPGWTPVAAMVPQMAQQMIPVMMVPINCVGTTDQR